MSPNQNKYVWTIRKPSKPFALGIKNIAAVEKKSFLSVCLPRDLRSALCRIPSISIIPINTAQWLRSPLEVSTLHHMVLTQCLKILSNELWIRCYIPEFPLFLDFPVFLISQALSNTFVSCFSLTELQQNKFLVSQTQRSSHSQCQGNIKTPLAKAFWRRVLAQINCSCFLRATSFQSRTNASFIFELQQPCDREEPVEQNCHWWR